MTKFREVDIAIIIDAVKNSHLHFKTLKEIKPILDSDGIPHLFVGGSATLFKVEYRGELYALKCYDYCDEEKQRSLQCINSYFSKIESSYISVGRVFLDELVVSTYDNQLYSLAVEIYPWIEGVSVSSMLSRAIYFGDQNSITASIDKLLKLSNWLIEQEFAHGDIKGDNIIVRDSGELMLIDFNNAYIDCFFSPPLHELGTDGFRHPLLDERYYNNRLDDYPLLVVLTTLLVAERSIEFYLANYDGEFTLFNTNKLTNGSCKNYIKAKELFKDTIIESRLLSLLESRKPSVRELPFWIDALTQLREAKGGRGVEIFCCDTTKKYGLADSENRVVIPAIFDDINRHSDELYAVEIASKWGVIDSDREIVVAINLDYISNIREDRLVVKHCGKYAYFDTEYNQITPFMFDSANSYHEGYAVVGVDNKYGYIDLSGEFVIDAIYDFAYNVKDKIATVRNKDNLDRINLDIKT